MLSNLPPELLIEISSHLGNAQALYHLSLTCRTLHNFVENEGWKTFARTRFPSIPVTDDWRNAAHGLTTLSRNWDRRALLARYIEPSDNIISFGDGQRSNRWRRPKGQTMGYRPCIDSYEEHLGTSWTKRKQVLAWGAGTELVIRVKQTDKASKGANMSDEHNSPTSWYTWRVPGGLEGRDDITAINVLRPHQWSAGADTEKVIMGTANGSLQALCFCPDWPLSVTLDSFNTDGRPVHSTDISSSNSPLLVACLSDTKLVLYPTQTHYEKSEIEPVSEVEIIPETPSNLRIWSTRFLSDSRLAIGLGPTTQPIHVYEVTPSGLSQHPIRKFPLDLAHSTANDRVDQATQRSSSVYPIAPLPASSVASEDEGNIFLSGGYDGIIRLHDMRSSSPYESLYWDPTDASSIFSLQTIGRERLVAGSARHSTLKFWDVRVSGGRAYHYVDVAASASTGRDLLQKDKVPNDAAPSPISPYGWNLFLNPRNLQQRGGSWRDRRRTESPVYTLSSPSPSSPSVFAGVEDSVVEIDFVSILDKHPDPVFSRALNRHPRSGAIDVKSTWNPKGNIMNLAMYEQTTSAGGAARLNIQAGVGKYPGSLPGYDERWRDGRDA